MVHRTECFSYFNSQVSGWTVRGWTADRGRLGLSSLPRLGDASGVGATPGAGLNLALELEDVGAATDRPLRDAHLPGDLGGLHARAPQLHKFRFPAPRHG